jgi:GDP-4-dehydro-6-deoxy-D-mannose reductase
MRAAVTGSSGFVGGHLVPYLRGLGDDVVTLDHTGDEPVDVTDTHVVRDVLRATRPDAVYHLAGLSHVGESWDAPEVVFRVNAGGALSVLRACSDAGVSRVLVVGSADEYGVVDEDDLPITEDAPVRPITPYGASKAAADVLALQAFLGDGLGTVRVRAFNHTGPGQSPTMLVPGLAARIAAAERSGEHEIRVGRLDVVRDLTDVRDVVRAYRQLIERGIPGDAYNVCSGRGVTVSGVAEILLAMTDAPLELVVDPELVRPVDVPHLVGSPAKLRSQTGWEPEIDLRSTLQDVFVEARTRAARKAAT